MTVEKLIEKLAKLDPKTRVVVDGYEDGFDDPVVGLVTVYDAQGRGEKLRWWSGRYSNSNVDIVGIRRRAIKAVRIGRRDYGT